MPSPTRDLSRSLHTLTARLDRAADRILQAEAGVSYSRFLVLFMVGSSGPGTQRALAERLGVTEPSVSKMTRVLEESGLIEALADPAGGHRRQLRLTAAGAQLVERWGGQLEERLALLVGACGVPYESYAEHTRRIAGAVEHGEPVPGVPARAGASAAPQSRST